MVFYRALVKSTPGVKYTVRKDILMLKGGYTFNIPEIVGFVIGGEIKQNGPILSSLGKWEVKHILFCRVSSKDDVSLGWRPSLKEGVSCSKMSSSVGNC